MSKVFNADSVPAVSIKAPRDLQSRASGSVYTRRALRQTRRAVRAL